MPVLSSRVMCFITMVLADVAKSRITELRVPARISATRPNTVPCAARNRSTKTRSNWSPDAARISSIHFAVDELTKIAAGLLVAGFDTTASIITYGVLALLNSPEQFALLRDNPALAPNAAEEVLRLLSNGAGLMRVATVDTEIAGTAIAAGDFVVAAVQAANHDPEQFADPEPVGRHQTARRAPRLRPRPAPVPWTAHRATRARHRAGHAATPSSVTAAGRAVR